MIENTVNEGDDDRVFLLFRQIFSIIYVSIERKSDMRIIHSCQLNAFEKYLCEEEKSDNTVQKYLRDLRLFSIWLDGKTVDKSVVLAYKKQLCEKYAPKSVNAALSSLNAFFAYMDWNDCKVKALKLQRRIFIDSQKELTKSEYERLLNAAKRAKNVRLYYLMQTIAGTGLRVSEVKYITCEAIRSGQATIHCKGKIRQIFLPIKLCKMLCSYIKQKKITKGAVFVTKNGKPLDRSVVWKMLKSLCAEAHVEKSKVFPHNLRHLFAKTFYSLQKDIVRLADILGHSNIETTRIYTMETGEIHRKQMQNLGLLRC